MTTLVTGAGLIGTAFAQEAVKRGERVVFLDVQPNRDYLRVKLGDAHVEIVRRDLRDLPALVEAVQSFKVETVVHTAGLIGSRVNSPLYTGLQVNVGGTINVAEAARLGGVRRFVHVSTNGVYNRRVQANGPIPEDHPRGGRGAYANSKVANEVLLETYADEYKFELLMVRPAAVFGYGHFVSGSSAGQRVQALVEGAVGGRVVSVPSSQAVAAEYVYAKDVGRMIDRLATMAMPAQRVFNAGTGIVSTFAELAEAAMVAMPGLHVEAGPPDSAGLPEPLDMSRAKELLEYEPAYSLVDAFRDYVEEYRRVMA